MDLLKKLYFDPLTGLQSKDKLYRKAKDIDKTITMKIVKQFLDTQATAQITKQHVVKSSDYDSIVSPAVQNNYQMDIMYLPQPTKNAKYLLTCIDVYSRFVMVRVLKDKVGDTVFKEIKDIFGDGYPKNLNVDLGSEFIYKPFVNYCEKNKINLWYSNPEQDNKNSIIERFHRTLRNMILKYTLTFGKSYIADIDNIIHNYNQTYHKTVKGIPFSIWWLKVPNKQIINSITHTFQLNDRVRHLQNRKVFGKHSSTSTYTAKVYTITKIDGHSYFLDELKKPFRNHELVLAVGEDVNTEFNKNIDTANSKLSFERRLRREGI
jgi:transposase InsO family protein